MSRIAITGIGVVAPGAVGVDAFRALLNSGESAIKPIDRFDTAGLSAHKAALVTNFTPRDFIAPMKMRRMNTLSRYGVSATKLALADRGGEAIDAGAGVVIGTSFGPVQTSVDYMQEYVEKGAALAPPQLFAESVANAPGSHIAIENGLRGFNVTVTQRESSALAAAMYASSQIAKGSAGAALIGGVEEVNEMIFSVLDRVGALAHTNGVVDEQARPFDRRRNGISIGEGAAILTIEASPARQPYAYISGFGIARDTTATISDWGTGHEAVAAAMRAAIADAEIDPANVGAVYSSANGSKRADRLEYRAIQSLFAGRRLPVVATKGYFGEYAAGGALQLAAAALAMRDQTLHKSAGFEAGEDEMHIDVNRDRRQVALDHILVNAISAGGGIVSMLLSREPK
ncbi:MAG TPA: beta-ketoacyl synthase N-terminal-like domain-containing protein [Thermoanaerobaculia bacterium]